MKKLYRSRKDRIFAGILGGLGNYFRIDPTFMRLLFIFICIMTAILPGIIAYLIAAVVIPLEPKGTKHPKYRRLYRSNTRKMIAGICGGIAETMNVDATLVRLLFLFLLFITGFFPLFVAYMVGWIIIPEKPNSKNVEIEIEEL